MKDLTISPMSAADLDTVIDWAAQEGWNPGLHDASAFHAADPDGFLLARYAGEPVASISAVRYGEDFGFIGLYIVKPMYRGQGFGWATWQAGMAHLSGRIIGLDGVIAQQENYQKSGFTLHHRNIRFEGRARPTNTLTPLATTATPTDKRIVPLSELDFELLTAYDQAFFPAGRAVFLAHWIKQIDGYSLALMHHNTLSGYGVIRPCRSGYKIGPLFAQTEQDAEQLLVSLSASISADAAIYLDVPECNPAAMRLAQHHAMQPMFETARMYTGTAPEMALERTFGISTFELG